MNKQVLQRLKEPSSWASIAAVMAIFLPVTPDQVQAAVQVAAVVAGAAGVLLKERGDKPASGEGAGDGR